ncbi:peptide ABC transporter substrate-binding protein [Vagococcus sp. BWB3-3]|uniref:Peptide ABC transporter substrate-binding protein n=1 Tax=Vagococcus allomyrinae TaxID=2794353 RepID=A0A940SSV4_9ENTE|nr:peptide ABC transporter substrate-binding protein [Vagococcus allomyrinae]MBP1039645.1 peptide ABC transporter substrate-binding protein [Vagococcus allomyrinae]
MKKRIGIYSGLILLVVFLASCSTNSATTSSTSQVDSTKQEITLANAQELNTIDPSNAIDANSRIVINNIYEGLYRLDESNQPVPAGAAELPEISADGLTYTIKLNDKATWSNGVKVTADDYLYAWNRAITSESAAENLPYFTNIKNAKEIIAGEKAASELGVRKIADLTVEITLHTASSYFSSLLANPPFFPLNKAYTESQGEEFSSDSDHAIYNGPFTLGDFAGPGIGGSWTYYKNDQYWDQEQVKLDKIDVQVIKETNSGIDLYKTGKIDQVAISGEYVKNEVSDQGFVSENAPTIAFFGYNHTSKIYQNEKIRQAISLVIDREALVTNILGDGSTVATGIVPPKLQINAETGKDFTDEAGNLLKTEVTEAQKLWAEAKKELNIEELTIRLISFDSDRMKSLATYIQGTVEENLAGAKVEVNISPVGVFIEQATKQDFDIYMPTWGADYADASSLLSLFQSESASNWGKYHNPEYDKQLAEANSTNANDAEARWANLQAAQKIILEEAGVTPIYFQSSAFLRNPKLKGIVYHTTGPSLDYKSAYLED